MKTYLSTKLARQLLLIGLLGLLTACTDGGGDRAPGVELGPDEPGGPVDPPPPILPPQPPGGSIGADDLGPDDSLEATIDGLSFNSPLTLAFSVVANGNQAVDGLSSSNVRFSLARLVDNAGDSVGQSWSAYILSQEDPVCRSQADIDNSNNQCSTFTADTNPGTIPDSAHKVQDSQAPGKTVENQGSTENNGTLVDNQDGSWSYTYSTDIGDPALRDEVHRACIQFSFNAELDNACVDFIPSGVADPAIGDRDTSLDDSFYDNYSSRQIAIEETCNSCHDKLALHGGGRTVLDYCVTCHNPDNTDANSTNTMDMKVLVHKLHFGRDLPSKVDDGEAYKIWGFNNGEHDYSTLSYPQKVIACTRCHAGQEEIDFALAQGLPMPEAVITPDGHSWVTNPTLAACTSCHEKLVTDNLKLDGTTPTTDHTSYTEERNCAGCHRDRGPDAPGAVQTDQAHRDLANEAGRALEIIIESVSNTASGQTPVVTFSIQDEGGSKLDLQDNAAMCATARYDLRIGYDAGDEFTARISGSGDPASLGIAGGNSFTMSPSAAVPAAVDTLAVTIDWNFPSDCADAGSEKARINAAVSHVASTASSATPRRTIIDEAQCNNCHGRFLETPFKHSGTRGVNSVETCVTCHNSEFATSDRTREMGVMTHAIHASGIRDSAHGSYDAARLQYPSDLSDCADCHANDSQLLPLPLQRQAIRTTSGPTYTTPIAALCSGCHDDAVAKAHMESAGGAVFDTDFNTANVAESCNVCHGSGKDADVDKVHNK